MRCIKKFLNKLRILKSLDNKKNKTEEHVDNATGTDVIRTPANKPGKQPQKQGTGDKDL